MKNMNIDIPPVADLLENSRYFYALSLAMDKHIQEFTQSVRNIEGVSPTRTVKLVNRYLPVLDKIYELSGDFDDAYLTSIEERRR